MTYPSTQSHMTYARLYDLSNLEKSKRLDQLESFDFMPCKAKLTLHRGDTAEDVLPSHDDIEAAFNAEEMYISGQEDYHKHFSSRVVSHNHAMIRWKSTQPFPHVVDIGSTHGTYLLRLGSNVSVTSLPSIIKDASLIDANEAMVLRDGDVIQLGKAVMRAKEEHQPARLLVKIFTGMSKMSKELDHDLYPLADEIDIDAMASKYAQEIFGVEDEEDDDGKIMSEDEEEEVTHVATRRATDPLLLDQSDLDDDRSIDFGIMDDDEEAEIIRESKDWRVSTTAEEDEEDGVETIEVAEKSYEAVDHKTVEEYCAESEDEEESDGEVMSSSCSEQDPEEQQKKREAVQDMELHTDYNAMIRADESHQQHMVNEAVKVAAKTVLKTLEVFKPEESMAVEEDAAPEMLVEMFVEGDSSQEEVSESLQSSPVIDQDGDASTDATSEAGEMIEIKEIVTEKIDSRMIGDYEMSNGVEEVARIAGKKRSHDDLEEGEEEKSVEVSAMETTRVRPPMNESPTFKKLKTFTAGLAAGILAGAVGTFVGLNSLVLNDSSFM